MAAYDLFKQARYVGAMRTLPVLLLVALAFRPMQRSSAGQHMLSMAVLSS